MHQAVRAALLASLVALPGAAFAQDARDTAIVAALRPYASSLRACLAAAPRTPRYMTVVHITARAANHEDSLPKAVQQSVDLMVETIGTYARARLGAAAGNLPYADSTQSSGLASLMFSSHLHAIGRRDGTVRWWGESDSTPTRNAPVDSVRRAGEQLLGLALDSALAAGESFQWPDDYAGADSIAFAVEFVYPVPDSKGTLRPIRARHATPLIAVHVTSNEPVAPRRNLEVAFPPRALRFGATGTVVMRFVVDTAGQVVPSTISDVWPAGRPRPRGAAASAYDAFVREATAGLRRAVYSPARVGGCAYATVVHQPFTFEIER